MKHPKRWTTDDEWYAAAGQVVDKIREERRGRTTPDENSLLFALRNDRVPEWWRGREENKSCGGCQARVWKTVTAKLDAFRASNEEKEEK